MHVRVGGPSAAQRNKGHGIKNIENNPMHSSHVVASIDIFCYPETDLTRRAKQWHIVRIPPSEPFAIPVRCLRAEADINQFTVPAEIVENDPEQTIRSTEYR
jgi:hypothetical protein